MPKLSLFLRKGIWSILSLSLMLVVGLIALFIVLESQLPNVDALKDVQLQVPLKVFSQDRELIAEFGEMRRIPVSFDKIPTPLIQALLATEDQRFYEHPGVDLVGLGRAVIELVRTGAKKQGGSTITMQVARNYFLNKKKTYIRKLNEILLAIKIDHSFSKQKILELYLNKIFMGYRAYGVAAAAEVYYGKTLDQLTLPEMAMLAGLPQAPSIVNPISAPEAAKKRRNHVLSRMYEGGYINLQTYQNAILAPISARYHGRDTTLEAPYAAEMVRQAMVKSYGEAAYAKGFQVYTTINSSYQRYANDAVQQTLLAYDRRHGYRGPEKNLASIRREEWLTVLRPIPVINKLEPAVVLKVTDRSLLVMRQDGHSVVIPWSGLSWARPATSNGWMGAVPRHASDIAKIGSVVRIVSHPQLGWALSQIPEVEGALVSLDPKNGAIQALVGGFSFGKSSFNRAVQALRQPGSSFKPFLYAAALAHGYTLASIINDAPVVFNDVSLRGLWRPQNDTRKFYGPTRLRVGLAKSRNLVSIRLLEAIGTPYLREYLVKLGFEPAALPDNLSLALGTTNVTVLDWAAKYAIFANGGYKIEPYLITSIQDIQGKEIARAHPVTLCVNCQTASQQSDSSVAPRVMDTEVNYLINLALRDVIQKGTGYQAKILGRQDLAGKTGTTQDHHDGWFAGFNGNVVTVTWLGFDQLKSLHEYAAQATLPMWITYMRQVLSGMPETPLIQPTGMISVPIDPKTGLLARPGQADAILEVFRPANVPKRYAPTEDDSMTGEPLF